MNSETEQLMNQQINRELYSAYLYLDFSVFFEDAGLPGFAHWYRVQAAEEEQHAMRIIRYMEDVKANITLSRIDAPDVDCEDVTTVLQKAREHEQFITSLILRLCRVADSANDYTTLRFLDWFVNEQREEETNADYMCSRVALCGDNEDGFYMLDRELAKREMK